MYIKNEKVANLHNEKINENKKYFEENSFEGSQFFKWVEEFNEMMEALSDLKNYKLSDGPKIQYEMHAVEEIADEAITRTQWNMSQKIKEDAIKKMKLEGVYDIYEKMSEMYLGNERAVETIAKEKIKRTEKYIKQGVYKQYLKGEDKK